MPDLWKALGDVYGDADDRPVHVEPAARDRVAAPAVMPLDDDLAAALSAALVDASMTPATPVTPVAPAPAAAPAVAPAAPAVAPAAPAVAPAAAPHASAAPRVAAAPPTAAVPTPVPAPAPAVTPTPAAAVEDSSDVQERMSSWLADIDARQRLREQGPPAEAIEHVAEAWKRHNDDILPAASARSGRRKGRRR